MGLLEMCKFHFQFSTFIICSYFFNPYYFLHIKFLNTILIRFFIINNVFNIERSNRGIFMINYLQKLFVKQIKLLFLPKYVIVATLVVLFFGVVITFGFAILIVLLLLLQSPLSFFISKQATRRMLKHTSSKKCIPTEVQFSINSFMTEAVIIQKPEWFLYDNGLRHERVKVVLRLKEMAVVGCNGIEID